MPCVLRYCHVLYPLVSNKNGHRTRDRSSRYHRRDEGTNEKNDDDDDDDCSVDMVYGSITSHSKVIVPTNKRETTTKPKKGRRSTTQTTNTSVVPPLPNHNGHKTLSLLQGTLDVHQELSGTGTKIPKKHSAHTTSRATQQKKSSQQRRGGSDPTNPVVKHGRIVAWSERPTKHGTPNHVSSANPCFSLTEYLAQEMDAQQLEDSRVIDDDDDRDDPPPCGAATIYGLHRPPAPIRNVCSGCAGSRDDDLNPTDEAAEDHPVLLCDGDHCGREYHMACCIPPMVSLPDADDDDNGDPWYCYDCCPDGTTAILRQYLDKNDKDMIDYYESNIQGLNDIEYVDYCIQQELIAKTNTHTKRKVVYKSPESELSIGAMIHSLALCDSTKLARTRGGHERRESLTPEEYIGKPVRLHDRSRDMYHTGRIVAYRNTVSGVSWGNYQPSSSKEKVTPNEAVSKCSNREYLIRFPAGKDHRKSTYHHWIRLEEHSLLVGTTIVWARATSGQWKPSILWLRSSLALIPSINAVERSKMESPIDISKTKHKVCALVRSFGDTINSVINVRDQCVDLSDTDATELHLYSHPDNLLLFSIARTELAEQSRVQDWFQLQQIDPIGPAVLSSRDYWTLPALDPSRDVCTALDTTQLLQLPNIRRSVDRCQLVQMLYRKGYHVSKDVAASISCSNLPFNHRTIAELSWNTGEDPTCSTGATRI